GAKNLKEGQKGLVLASFIKILGPIIVVLPGIIAYHLFEGNLESADSAYPELVRKVLPGAWVGFFAAVLFGAILSSFNSVLNSSVTLFGIDVYKQHINKNADEKTVVKYGKAFGVVLAIASMFIAPLIANAGSLFAYLQEINGIYSIPILTIIVVGYLTKRVPAIAAKVGLISGCLLYILSQFIMQPYFINTALENAKVLGITDQAELALVKAQAYPHFLDIMAILFVLNVVIMLVIGKIKPREEAFVQEYTKQVDITPWKYTKQAGIAICVIVIGVYVYFA
ncbi:MAG: SSS family solute:Na+ symporter, partial [Urechidicola sp.]